MLHTFDYSLQAYRDDVREAERRVQLLREASERETTSPRRRMRPAFFGRWRSARAERHPGITFS